MSEFEFVIEEGIEIPKREIVGRQRGSKYPLEQMTEGQSFALTGLTDKQSRQKQSQFSELGKSRGIIVVTRFNKETGTLRIWHGGFRDQAAADANAANAGQALDL